MSPERYPLVIFGGSERHGLDLGSGKKRRQKALDPPTSRGDKDEEEDSGSDSLDRCLLNPYDVHCLTGVRPFEEGDGVEGRMRRLLDGPKTASSSSWSSSTPAGQQPVVVEVGQQQPWGGESENSSGNTVPTIDDGRPPQMPLGASRWPWMLGSVGGESGVGVGGMWDGVVVGLLFGLATFWLVWGKAKGGKKKPTSLAGETEETTRSVGVDVDSGESAMLQVNGGAPPLVEQGPEETNTEVDNVPILPNGKGHQLSINLPATPTLNLTKPLPEVPTPGVDNDEGDDSDAEGESGLPTTPGKRKARRGKRGRKKKAASGDGGDKEVEVLSSSSLVLTPKLPVVSQPSLIVTETILGASVFNLYLESTNHLNFIQASDHTARSCSKGPSKGGP